MGLLLDIVIYSGIIFANSYTSTPNQLPVSGLQSPSRRSSVEQK